MERAGCLCHKERLPLGDLLSTDRVTVKIPYGSITLPRSIVY